MSYLTRKERYLEAELNWNTSAEIICRLLVVMFVFFAAVMSFLIFLGFADLSFPLFKDSYIIDFWTLGIIGFILGLIIACFSAFPLYYSRRAKTLNFWIYFVLIINVIFYLFLISLVLFTLIKFHKIDIYLLIGFIGILFLIPIVLYCLFYLKKEIKRQWLARKKFEAKQDLKIIKSVTNIVQSLNEENIK